jgi:hypothetical protein
MNRDVEKRAGADDPSLVEEETGAVSASSFAYGNSMYARLQRLGGKIKVEQRGIERVPDGERNDSSYWNIGSMVLPPSSLLKLSLTRAQTTPVAGCKYGGPLFHHWCLGEAFVRHGIH